MSKVLTELATEAYIYGYPLVFNVTEIQQVGQVGMGTMKGVPMNQFSHAKQLATPDDPFVSVNNDTVYSIAMLDLSGGPIVLHVPDTGGAYYVLQFVDAWSNNFAYVGRRATGTAEAEFTIVPPGWDGDIAHGTRKIEAPTSVVAIIGRVACDGPDDITRVVALQKELTLEPTTNGRPLGIPQPSPQIGEDLAFWEKLRLWIQAFPPSTDDQKYQDKFGPLGLLESDTPYQSPPAELAAALIASKKAGAEEVERLSKGNHAHSVNGWLSGLHQFDYNLDYFEIGAIDSDTWKLADRSQARTTRAVSDRLALWGNHAYEAVYEQVFTDDSGEQLDGSHKYEITCTELPPVDGFWSLTMYALPEYYLVANSIERYSIGDRTKGVTYSGDDSLTNRAREPIELITNQGGTDAVSKRFGFKRSHLAELQD